MSSLNKIEKHLKTQVDNELSKIVNNFLDEVEKLTDKYGRRSSYFYLLNPNYEKETKCISRGMVEKHLLYMLDYSYGEHMLSYKSKELLNKIDLLS